MEESVLESFKKSMANELIQKALKVSDANLNMLRASIILGEKHDLLALQLQNIMSHPYMQDSVYKTSVDKQFIQISEMYEEALDLLDQTHDIDPTLWETTTKNNSSAINKVSSARQLLDHQKHNNLIYTKSLQLEFRALSAMKCLVSKSEKCLNSMRDSDACSGVQRNI